METTKLRNGAEEAAGLVAVTMLALRNLFAEKPIVAYELVAKCRDANHQFFGLTGSDLQTLGLVETGGGVHESIRNIVLSAVSEGFGVDLGQSGCLILHLSPASGLGRAIKPIARH